LRLTTAYYWDLNDKTRAFAKRFAEKYKGRMPTMVQAGFYSATLRYLQVVKETGTDKAETVMAKLKSEKWDDPVFGPSYIRADGRNMHEMYLFEVKAPSESKGPWDYYKLLAKVPAEQAFRPLDEGGCPLVKKN
jgi:branched-chain amino acid transport system substrate-binding protein